MVLTKRGKGGGRSSGQAPRQANIGRCLPSEPATWSLGDERQSSSDDSTQPPDVECEALLDLCNEADQTNTTGQEDVPATSKHRRGVAKGTEFERLRKLGKIPLDIKDGKIGPSCNNRTVYTTRVTWIIKHYAEMRHVSWKVVGLKEKNELIERVRADFVLDWTKKNHRQIVTNQLCRAYNAFHYLLHLKYKEYATHEEALANGGTLVEKPIWEWLCNRWVSEPFKKMSTQNRDNRRKQKVNHTSGRTSFVVLMEQKKDKNLISFYKDVHWSTKKGRFITPTTEENYNKMVEMMNAKEPESHTDDVAAEIFREVLGHRSGYSRGLDHSVIPESSKVSGVPTEDYERLAEENEQNKKNAEDYQNRFEEIQNGFMAMREHVQDYEKHVNHRLSDFGSELESQRETQGDL